MSEPKKKKQEPTGPRAFGWMAEYAEEHQLLDAAKRVRDSGYTKTDAFTPFPVHGIDEALGIKPTILPFLVLGAGLTGMTTAIVMQIWMNAIDYPYIISGKPFISLPAFIPVTFELTILFSAFTAFLGMLALNQLPKFSNPVFTSARFDRVTDDRFFLYVDAKDKYYNREAVRKLLADTHPDSLEEVMDDTTPAEVPRAIWLTIGALAVFALIPPAVILRMRAAKSTDPRIHVFLDMDFQPKKKPQQATTIFADGRITRPQVVGTVARGQFEPEGAYQLGYDPEVAAAQQAAKLRLVTTANQEPAAPAAGQPPAEQPPAPPQETPPAPAPEAPAPAAETPVPAAPAPQTPAPTAETPASPGTPAPAADASQPPAVPATPPADAAHADPAAAPAPAAAAQTGGLNLDTLPWLTTFPEGVATEANMARGKQRFEIYCAACHGVAGEGNGLVAQRAAALAQGYWLAPTSLHDKKVRDQPVGRIYHTITNGLNKMGGYRSQINAEDRWAIALYVRALQRSRSAAETDLPEADRAQIQGK